jgi:hypothetical protein
MVNTLLALLLLAVAPQAETFKKERAPLEAAADATISSTGSPLMQRSRAAYIEGYGIVVSMEIAFEIPPSPFSSAKTPAQVRASVAQRRKDVQEKMTAFVKQRVATTDSIGAKESLAVVIHVLNTTLADVPNLPSQIVMGATKQSPQQVAFREY